MSEGSVRAVRRPRGEPRRLLLDAARELFARQDYRSTTTREISLAAGVSEYLLFRHFGSKAGLFREALVLPFTSFVDEFGRTWQSVVSEETDEAEVARLFVGRLYDVIVEHRGLLQTLAASETFSEEEIADAGIDDIRRAIAVLGQISAEGMRLRGLRSSQPDVPAHSTVAMVVGMVAVRSTFFGTNQPSRGAILDELVQASLHGFLHRHDGSRLVPERIQLRRTKGWRKPEGAIVVARPSKWGNPFVVGQDIVVQGRALRVTPALAVALYRVWVDQFAADAREELAGHDLACWCPLSQPCHADVLLELGNQEVAK